MRRQSGGKDRYVLDTSAFFALFENEDGVEIVQGLLKGVQKGDIIVFCSFVTYTEVFYVTCQESGEDAAQCRVDLMDELAIIRMDSSQDLGLIAGKLKANHRISFADAWVAATAIMQEAILVHKDPEFDELGTELQMLRLPYKT